MTEIKEDFITKELAKYNLPDAVIAKLRTDYLAIKVASVDDIDNYLAAKEAHQTVKDLRINIEKKRKELKSASLDFGRAVDNEAKRLSTAVEEIEEHLLKQRNVVEDEKRRIQKEKEEAERKEQERLRHEAEARLEAIRKDQEEKERIIREENEKIEREKKAIAEEKEKNRLEKERLEREKKEAEEAKVRAEREEKERKAREERHRAEIILAEKAAAEKAKHEAEEKAKREAAEKAEADRKAKEEKERQEALKPDIEKIKSLAKSIEGFKFPNVTSAVAAKVVNSVKQKMLKIAEELMNVKL